MCGARVDANPVAAGQNKREPVFRVRQELERRDDPEASPTQIMNDERLAKREKSAEDISDFSNPHGRTTFQLLAPGADEAQKPCPRENADG